MGSEDVGSQDGARVAVFQGEVVMVWMVLIMGLPLLGLALFLVCPWRVALLPYLTLVAVSGFFDRLMMHSMRVPACSGREEMIGSTAVVLDWEGGSGQVIWKGEIWQARGSGPFARGESVVIGGLSGLILSVKAGAGDRGSGH